MKQRNRIKKLQRFLFATGRMHPGCMWSVTRQGFSGAYYRSSKSTSFGVVKGVYRRIHLECRNCAGYGYEWVGYSEQHITGTDTCTKCNGSMWSKKAYRLG